MTMQREPAGTYSFGVGDSWQNTSIVSLDTVAPAISDVAIRPTLLHRGTTQILAFYDEERRLTIANRNIRGFTWDFVRLNSQVGWDSHNYIDLGFDPTGRLHVAGNMHASPLQYWTIDFNTDSDPRRIEVLAAVSKEQQVTYPRFLRDTQGQLLFSYRDGSSGDGDFICLRWDNECQKYRTLTDGPVIKGEGIRNPYIDTNAPILGPDNKWHMLWVWRDSPNAESTHTVNYACSTDLLSWSNGFGAPLSHPIRYGSATIVDPVPPNEGLINNNVRLGFLPNGNPLAVYHKRDKSANQQLWAATVIDGQWMHRQLTDWTFRWDFSGTGSLDFMIEVGTPETTGSSVTVDIRRDQEVETLQIDEQLRVVSVEPAAPWTQLRRTPGPDGRYERVTRGRSWSPEDPGPEWLVSHVSVSEQRDQKPSGESVPPQLITVMETSAMR